MQFLIDRLSWFWFETLPVFLRAFLFERQFRPHRYGLLWCAAVFLAAFTFPEQP